MMQNLGIIGGGGMAATVLQALADNLDTPLDHVALLVRPRGVDAATALLENFGGRLAARCSVHTTLSGLLDAAPEVVAECAGHGAVRDYGAAVLSHGCDFMVISIGALAEDALYGALRDAAMRGKSRLLVPPGAVGGIDLLCAARLSGLEAVVYAGHKPPRAWRGTRAEALLDLDALREPAQFFEGSAREAARDYPQNANVAATVALAGLGLDATRVRLIADPGLTRNVHELSVRSSCADFTIRMEGRPSPGNPKTSLAAGYSVARALLNRSAAVVV